GTVLDLGGATPAGQRSRGWGELQNLATHEHAGLVQGLAVVVEELLHLPQPLGRDVSLARFAVVQQQCIVHRSSPSSVSSLVAPVAAGTVMTIREGRNRHCCPVISTSSNL